MNKTIIININGIVFHIEEDAYEVLKHYMTEVKRHFMDSADSLEITTDIENRIAEMFTEALARDGKQVIIEQDVRNVVAQMGTVEDFASADEDGNPPLNTGFTPRTGDRRLFRNADDHLLGGVCAGIANYFDIQTIWVRLAFALTFVFFGTGLLVYVILWIVVPKAITRADRMAMKGEPLDLQGFKRNFEGEIRNVGTTFNNLHQDARPGIYKTRDFISDFFHHLGAFLRGSGKVLVKIIGIAIILGCSGFIIALVVSLFGYFAYESTGITNIFPFNIINHEYNVPFMVGSLLVLALPLLSILLLTVRLTFQRTTINRSTAFTMLAVWLSAVCVVTYYSIKVAAEFRASGRLSQNVSIKPTANNTYYLELNQLKYLTAEDSTELGIKNNLNGRQIIDDDDDFEFDNLQREVTLYVEKADVAQPVLVEEFSSRGRNKSDALQNAQKITYHFVQKDSLLRFDRFPDLHSKKFRDQEVKLILRVPLNSKLVIDTELDRLLRDISVYDCRASNNDENAKSATFIMKENGLECKIDTLIIKTDTLRK